MDKSPSLRKGYCSFSPAIVPIRNLGPHLANTSYTPYTRNTPDHTHGWDGMGWDGQINGGTTATAQEGTGNKQTNTHTHGTMMPHTGAVRCGGGVLILVCAFHRKFGWHLDQHS